MLKCTRNLSALCRPTRQFASLARFTSRCAFTMRGISLDGNAPRFFAPELNSDLMFEGTRKLPALCRTARTVAISKRVTCRCALKMRSISLDAKRPHILVPETSLDLMPKGTQYLSAPRRIVRTAAAPTRFSSQCAFTMRGISLDAKCPHLLVLELSSDLVLNGTRILPALCHLTRAVATSAQFIPRCAFTMRSVSHEENQHSYSVPELRADFMRKRIRTVATLA